MEWLKIKGRRIAPDLTDYYFTKEREKKEVESAERAEDYVQKLLDILDEFLSDRGLNPSDFPLRHKRTAIVVSLNKPKAGKTNKERITDLLLYWKEHPQRAPDLDISDLDKKTYEQLFGKESPSYLPRDLLIKSILEENRRKARERELKKEAELSK